jgi:hypothetical protein
MNVLSVDTNDCDYLGVSVIARNCFFLRRVLPAVIFPSIGFLSHRRRRKVRNTRCSFHVSYSNMHYLGCYHIHLALLPCPRFQECS